eukprot:14551704-Alexandrium_andersonii.AAC.1
MTLVLGAGSAGRLWRRKDRIQPEFANARIRERHHQQLASFLSTRRHRSESETNRGHLVHVHAARVSV